MEQSNETTLDALLNELKTFSFPLIKSTGSDKISKLAKGTHEKGSHELVKKTGLILDDNI